MDITVQVLFDAVWSFRSALFRNVLLLFHCFCCCSFFFCWFQFFNFLWSLLFLNACRLLKKIPIVSAFTFGEMAGTALVKEKGSWREALNSPYAWLRQTSKFHQQASFVNKIFCICTFCAWVFFSTLLPWEFISVKLRLFLISKRGLVVKFACVT